MKKKAKKSLRQETQAAVEVLRADTHQIVVPPDMDFDKAIEWLQRKRDEEKREVNIRRIMEHHPFDAAHAIGIAAKEMFGFADMRNPSWWERKPPPTIIAVPSDAHGGTVPVMWGMIQFPNIDGYIQTGIEVVRGRFVLSIGGTIRRKNERTINQLVDLAEEVLETQSLYKGKALRCEFKDPDQCDDILDLAPEFMNLDGIGMHSIVFGKMTGSAINTNLFTPIMHTDQCREAGVPIKRGVLLCGKYGTGKTLTANVTAALCEEHGWTFVYAKTVQQLAHAINFAKKYQPSLVFAEDLDEVVTRGRDHDVNQLLNTIDGIDNKTNEVMVVLTTNHVERINPAMLRPSRLDAVIMVEPPDADAAVRLVERYGGSLLDRSSDLSEVGRKLAGHIPAVIQEVVERSKLGAIANGTGRIQAPDLLVAAQTMETQIELIKPEVLDDRSDMVKAAAVIAEAMRPGLNGQSSKPGVRAARGEPVLEGRG